MMHKSLLLIAALCCALLIECRQGNGRSNSANNNRKRKNKTFLAVIADLTNSPYFRPDQISEPEGEFIKGWEVQNNTTFTKFERVKDTFLITKPGTYMVFSTIVFHRTDEIEQTDIKPFYVEVDKKYKYMCQGLTIQVDTNGDRLRACQVKFVYPKTSQVSTSLTVQSTVVGLQIYTKGGQSSLGISKLN